MLPARPGGSRPPAAPSSNGWRENLCRGSRCSGSDNGTFSTFSSRWMVGREDTRARKPATVRGRGMKFGIGQPMRRHEDLRLMTGRGRYTDDVILPRMTHAFVLRSPVAHAHIKRIDAAAARRMPGVLFVATGEDVRVDGLGDVPCMVPLVNRDGTPRYDTPRPVLALGRVRHVGQPVALVVAETLVAARDAAEAIEIEYEPLPAVTEATDAIGSGAPLLF